MASSGDTGDSRSLTHEPVTFRAVPHKGARGPEMAELGAGATLRPHTRALILLDVRLILAGNFGQIVRRAHERYRTSASRCQVSQAFDPLSATFEPRHRCPLHAIAPKEGQAPSTPRVFRRGRFPSQAPECSSSGAPPSRR